MKKLPLLLLATALGGGALLFTSCTDDDPSDLLVSEVISAQDDFFTPKVDTIQVGTIVTWVNEGAHDHTVDSDEEIVNGQIARIFDREIAPGEQFSFRFLQPGEFPYHCEFHGAVGGVGMSGVIVVVP